MVRKLFFFIWVHGGFILNFIDYIENQELGSTEQYLIDALHTDANACLICIETIESKEPVRLT